MAAVIGFFLIFAVFLFGQAPIIYVGDSPLFSTASFYLSTAHPPGYPLFITLGKLFTFLPFGSIASRVGLLSAVSACLAWLVLYKLIKRLTGNGALAFSFAFLPEFLPLVYQQSVEQKGVYALNSFFGLLIMYLGVRAYEDDDTRFIYIIAFLFGLGSGNHHTLALFLIPALVPFWAVVLKKKRWGAVFRSTIFFSGGFLIYLHVYLRSLALAERGFIYSIATDLSGFLFIFFRKAYQVNTLQGLKAMGTTHATAYFTGAKNAIRYVIASQYGAAATGIFFISLLFLIFSRMKKILKVYILLAVLPWVVLLPEMAFGGNPGESTIQIVRPYFLPVLFLIALVLALAADRAWLYLKAKNLRTLKAAQVFLLVPLIYLPGTLKYSLSDSFISYDYARDSISALPANSVLFLYGDNPTFEDYYIHWVERYREDVLTLSRLPGREAYSISGRAYFLVNNSLFNGFLESNGKSTLMNSSYIDALSREGRLFTTDADAMLKILQKNFKIPALWNIDEMLLEKGTPDETANKFILENYQKLNYERAAAEYSNEYFVAEMKNLYGFTLFSASLINKEQEEKDRLTGMALKLVDPEKFLPYYVFNMIKNHGETKAFSFLHQIEGNWRYTKMADIAQVMEYILLSRSGGPLLTAKYTYLKEHGLLVYLPDVSNIWRAILVAARKTSSSG